LRLVFVVPEGFLAGDDCSTKRRYQHQTYIEVFAGLAALLALLITTLSDIAVQIAHTILDFLIVLVLLDVVLPSEVIFLPHEGSSLVVQ